MNLLFFALPALALLALCVLVTRRPAGLPVGPAVLPALLVAVIAGASVVALVNSSAYWRGATQIIWRAVEPRPGRNDLQVGGARGAATLGWPTGAFAPWLQVSPAEPGRVRLRVGGGQGFVSVAGRVINGDSLVVGRPLTIGRFTLVSTRRWGALEFSVRGQGGEEVASFRMRSPRTDRIVSVSALVSKSVVLLRTRHDTALAAQLEDWAAGLMLFAGRGLGQVRVLPDTASYAASVDAPAALRVRWLRISTRGRLLLTPEGAAAVEFGAPWNSSSPVPTARETGGKAVNLVFTGRPRPGDVAFALPLGAALEGERSVVAMDGDHFTPGPGALAPTRKDAGSGAVPRDQGAGAAVTSRRFVDAGSFRLTLETVRDLPRTGQLLFALLLALAALGSAMAIVLRGVRREEALTAASMSAAVFTLLALRLLLACRYALEPSRVDGLSVGGLINAVWALTFMPGVLLVAARLWYDRTAMDMQRRDVAASRLRMLRWMAFVLVPLMVLAALLVSTFWPDLPPAFDTQPRVRFAGYALTWFLLACVVWASGRSDRLAPGERPRRWSGPRSPAALCERGFAFVHDFATGTAPELWDRIAAPAIPAPGARPVGWLRERRPILLLALLVLLIVFLTAWGVPVLHEVQQVVVPFLLFWLPAVFWLASRRRFPPGAEPPRLGIGDTLLLGFGLLLVPVFVVPAIMKDVGGVVTTLSVFVPLLALLLLGGRPRRLGAVAGTALACAFALMLALFVNLHPILPTLSRMGPAAVRLLVFKEDRSALQERMPWLPVARGRGAGGMTTVDLAQGIQHTWENEAMAHAGGWTGLGFGHAPARRSQIRQDTLQFDSTFSFFILGEYGLLGGLALLLIYMAPLWLVLASGRRRFDLGHGVAAIVASAFLIEALFHMGMNLCAIPFTGRNLSLLAVNSPSDLLRWGLLFGLMMQAMHWRHSGEPGAERDVSIATTTRAGREPEPVYRRRLGLALGLPILLLSTLVLSSAVRNVTNRALANPFDWSEMLQRVRELLAQGSVRLEPATNRLVFDPRLRGSEGTLLEQEVERFNGLTLDEKLEGVRPLEAERLHEALRGVRTLADYDAALLGLRAFSDSLPRSARPPLFRMLPPRRWADDEATIPAVGATYRAEVNPDYNVRASFRVWRAADQIPVVTFRSGRHDRFVVRGPGVEFTVGPSVMSTPGIRNVALRIDRQGDMKLATSGPGTARQTDVALVVPVGRGGARRRVSLGSFVARHDTLLFRCGDFLLERRSEAKGQTNLLRGRVPVRLMPGDRIATAEMIPPGIKPTFEIGRHQDGVLLGPAWVSGEWSIALDPASSVPWTELLAQGIGEERRKGGPGGRAGRYETLTLDRDLQASAQAFTAREGRASHAKEMPATTWKGALPPRVALAVVDLGKGEVLALGGWPRMNPTRAWRYGADGEPIPPWSWVEGRAPLAIRSRYGGDRNFDAIVVGSATKPLFASAVLGVHPDLDTRLAVQGPAGEESRVFGIPIGRPWNVDASSGFARSSWADFDAYLAHSDNRYQVRLGFLGLAATDPSAVGGVAVEETRSPSLSESMDRGRHPWRRYPAFPAELGLSSRSPQQLFSVDQTPLAQHLQDMYAIGIRQGEVGRRLSFWSGDERHEWPQGEEATDRPGDRMQAISPQAPDFALDQVSDPRQYVNLLLGGADNMWANVDLAGAFARCLTGGPVVPHIARLPDGPRALATSERFAKTSARLRRALARVVQPEGTAYEGLHGTKGLAVLRSLGPKVSIFAKTGTLAVDEGAGEAAQERRYTSRILLAVTRGDGSPGKPFRGLVFSVVAERTEMGAATRMLGRFLVENQGRIRALLEER